MFRLARTLTVATSLVVLVACAQSDDGAQNASPPLMTTQDLSTLLAQAEYRNLVEAVRAKQLAGLASDEDLLLQARGYIALLDGIGAALALEKVSAPVNNTPTFHLLSARTFFLEGELDKALNRLERAAFQGDDAYGAHVLRGDILFLQNNIEPANLSFSEAIALDETRYEAYLARAQLNLRSGQIEQAGQDAEQAVAIAPESSLAHYVLGAVFLQTGKFADAKTQFRNAVDYFPYNVQALLGLANIAIVEGEYYEADYLLDEVYAVSPEDTTARFFTAMLLALQGDDILAREQLIELSFEGDQNPQMARLVGHVAYRLGDRDIALRKLMMVLEAAPFDRVSRLVAAEIQISNSEPEAAMELLAPMLAIESQNDLPAISMAATASAQMSDFDSAVRYTEQAIKLAEAPATILDGDQIAGKISNRSIDVQKRQLASYHFSNGAPEKAYDVLEAMVAAQPGDQTSLVLLSNIQMQKGDFDAAIATADRIISQSDGTAVGHNARGAALHRAGRIEEAIVAYSAAIELSTDYVSARRNRGMLYLETKKFDLALVDLEQVLARTPNDAGGKFMYARAMLGLERAGDALISFDQLTRVLPGSVNVMYYRALALADLEQYSDAIEQLEQAIARNSSQPELEQTLLEETLQKTIADFEAANAPPPEATDEDEAPDASF